MDVLNAIFNKFEHGKIQLAKCKYMILYTGFTETKLPLETF